MRIVQQFCKLAFIMKLNIVNLMKMVEVLVSLFGYIGMEAYYREENIFPSECLPERGGGVHLWQKEFRFLLLYQFVKSSIYYHICVICSLYGEVQLLLMHES